MNAESNGKTILVGEDDGEVRSYLEVSLRCRGYDVLLAPDGREVLNLLRSDRRVSAVLLDVMLPNLDGLETLQEIRQTHADLPVIMLSGMASPLNIVKAMKIGASDFLAKPVNHEDLDKAIQQAIASAPTRPQSWNSDGLSGGQMYCGTNSEMRALMACIPKIVASDVPILIQGETGTGKEVLARELHAASPRANKPFLKLNCAAIPSDLMESELFGYERGAFTGAFQRKPGVFEMADGGTLLLDEIGDMDLRLQSKLLQVLQNQEFRRLGGREDVRVQVRVMAATHRDLLEAIQNETFRQDLYYRLSVFTLTIPAMRERQEDIIGMTQFLINKHSSREVPPVVLTPTLKQALLDYDWPGNVRQLENIVRKLMVLREPDAIVEELESLRNWSRKNQTAPLAGKTAKMSQHRAIGDPSSILDQVSRAKEAAEAAAILDALDMTRWNRKRAAERLNIDYKAFLYKMKKLSIADRAEQNRTAIA